MENRITEKMMAINASDCVIDVLAAVLVGLYFGTQQDPLDLIEISV